MGAVFAHNSRAYRRWRSAFERLAKKPKQLAPDALEAAVMRVAEMFPKNVSRGTVA